MDLNNTMVRVTHEHYEGPALVRDFNNDDSDTLLIEETATVWCVPATAVTRHTAQRLLTYGQYGEPEVVEEIFGRYLSAPEALSRELYHEHEQRR